MKDFSYFPNFVSRITRGAVCVAQKSRYLSSEKEFWYSIRVCYPNGYGVSVIYQSDLDSDDDGWEVAIFKDGELCRDYGADGILAVSADEEEVVRLCDKVYFR
jgi:hypothetical protein